MKHNAKISISAVLLLASLLIACGSEQADTPANDTATELPPTTESAEQEVTRTPHKVDVDALDFGGDTLDMLASTWSGYLFYFFADEENGDIMNDAIYRRKQAVENALNISIVTHQDGYYINEVYSELSKTVLAGDSTYDMVFNHCITGISSSVSEGLLYNLDTLPHIDMTADWWNREQMDVLRLGNNTYFAVNDMMLPAPYVMFFNKSMVLAYDMTDPYQLVHEGKWTLDAFTEMVRTVKADIDGDGKMTEADNWGLAAPDESLYISFMTGAGQYMTDRDENGRIRLAINTEKTQSLMDLFATLSKEEVICPSGTDVSKAISFDAGRLLFVTGCITDAENMRDYTVDFGFLPYPKYDEAQENYLSLDWGGLLSIPATISDPAMVGAAMELLAWESRNEVIPTYYEKILVGKLARDDETEKMMDLLFDTITYEVGGNYFGFSSGTSELFYLLPKQAVEQQKSNLASLYAKLEKSASKTISKFYDALEKVEDLG